MTAAPLEVVGLTAGYGETRILDDISFTVPPGGRLAVLGRNGVGKTTLLATLVGLTRLYSGGIFLGSHNLARLKTSARALRGLGYVPQTRDVFQSLTVEENLFVGLKGLPRTAAEEAYRLFPRLKERQANVASQLSGGEQQMLSTARAILGRPSVLLMDEPLEGLAPVICDELMSALTKLASQGTMTILLVEQQIERALDFADKVLILERGRNVWCGMSSSLRLDQAVIERHLGVSPLHSRTRGIAELR
jgi:branched-chain amino acid transport system ATP-binding protein